MTLRAAISSDIDTLESIYGGRGCRRPGGYSYVELPRGLDCFAEFLDDYGVQATLFMVGRDFLRPDGADAILDVVERGHEIANHTMTHAQGFRLLDQRAKEQEIAGMEEACEALTGRRPVGFRSPGWNADDETAGLLAKRGYLYDSSVFPTALMPLLKLLHWRSSRARPALERSTMGQLSYMLAPTRPYRAQVDRLGRRGSGGLVEIPITVTPVLRIPVFATFLLATGLRLFEASLRALRLWRRPVQFMFHLSDFVDYGAADLSDQVPTRGDGVYVPQSLSTPLSEKLSLFRAAMDLISRDYSFVTLAEWARQVPP